MANYFPERRITVVLHIFSASNKERSALIKHYFQREQCEKTTGQSVLDNLQSVTKSVKSIKAQKHFQRIPGYWLIVDFKQDHKGLQLYHRVLNQLAPHRINDQVFYPVTELPGAQLETRWMEKYSFSEENMEEVSRLFLDEIKSHLKEGRAATAYHGILLLLRLNPFFMKKYRRYYILEDLAYHFEGVGNINKAIKCFQLQIRIRPDSPEPYLNISSFYIINGMEEQALPMLKKAVSKHPDNPYLMSNLVIAMCNMGSFDAAITVLKKALEKDIQNGVYWKMLGDVFYEIEENETAIRCFKKGIRLIKEDKHKDLASDLHSGIAACYYEDGLYKKALKHYLKVIELHPEDSYTLISLAQLYFYKLNQSTEALKYTKKILDAMPENGYAHYHIGLIYMDLQLMEKARWHLYKARRLMPYYNPIHEAIQMLKKDGLHRTPHRKNHRSRSDQ